MITPVQSGSTAQDAAARRLLNAQAVRERCRQLLSLGAAGSLEHFIVDMGRLEPTCDYVVRVIRSNYPGSIVPPFSRWRHFEIGEVDRWGGLVGQQAWTDKASAARAGIDLALVSILLDAATGRDWSFAEADTGETFGRSEGTAIASLTMFARGAFSADPYDPLRADARVLSGMTLEELRDGLQVSQGNPLPGLELRLHHLARLGQTLQARADIFNTPNGLRPGGLYDHIAKSARGDSSVSAAQVLEIVLTVLAPVWPGPYVLGNTQLGDTWHHSRIRTDDGSDGLVPLHRVAQTLVYSMIEPLAWGGIQMRDLDQLTGLADFRTGGLFIDIGLMKLRSHAATLEVFPIDHEVVVEWRALTVALIDRLMDGVRKRLTRSPEMFSLPCLIEGGTWAAGRRIAREKRSSGDPPIMVANEGTYVL